MLSSKEKNRIRSSYGPWAVVTGASSGIGRELATQLASAGVNLLIAARREPLLQELAQELAKTGIQTQVLATDLTKEEGMNALKKASNELEIGLLIAAAGYGTSGNFIHADVLDESRMTHLNCTVLMQLTHHFANRFVNRGQGGIILLSSMVSFQGVPYAASYAATKAYVQSLGEALHVELKPHNIDVLAAAPGPVKSGFAQRANMQMSMTLTPEQVGAPILKALGRRGTVLPGLLTKFLVTSLRMIPRWGKVRVMKLVMGGMTAHQRTDNSPGEVSPA